MKKLAPASVIGICLAAVLCVTILVKVSSASAVPLETGIADSSATAGESDNVAPESEPAPDMPIFLSSFPPERALTPIPADPWDMLRYPVSDWRDDRFELFSWDRFPELLLLDFSSQQIQDRLLKRLAFFVEKAGFRGRVLHDREIAHLYAWNAHDYQASDLAVFFRYARDNDFPLLDEEWELEAMLLRSGVLRLDPAARIVPGRGAILSVSRESVPELRTRFMAHEMFHGLFFIDENFREFSRQRWEAFPQFAKDFFVAYLGTLSYATDYEFLIINEFMAYLLQLPVSQAPWYFGQHLSGQLHSRGLTRFLPADYQMRDGIRYWPEIAATFTAEAEAFSRYVNDRWGLAAGRVWRPR
ncbi:MAG: hypothetical protein FWD94_08145 [Treponema sp.]|nr:hypothetical protein [Treponema sp.]